MLPARFDPVIRVLVRRWIVHAGKTGFLYILDRRTGKPILGINEKISVWSLIALLPIFLWELSLGLWMTFKGFRKEAPLMVEAAAQSPHGSAPAVLSPIAVATTAGAV